VTKISLLITFCWYFYPTYYLPDTSTISEEVAFYGLFYRANSNEIQKEKLLFIAIVFSTFVLPNLICSIISIALTTGLNKSFFKVIIEYPTAWMLPICTFFVIGCQNLACKSGSIRQRHLLGISKNCTIINMIMTMIVYSIAIVLMNYLRTKHFTIDLIYFILLYSIMIFGYLFTLILLLLDQECCCSASKNCLCQWCCGYQCYQYEKHVIDVSKDNLEIIVINNRK